MVGRESTRENWSLSAAPASIEVILSIGTDLNLVADDLDAALDNSLHMLRVKVAEAEELDP